MKNISYGPCKNVKQSQKKSILDSNKDIIFLHTDWYSYLNTENL